MRRPVGLLYDSISNNTGDKAIGIVAQKLFESWGVDFEIVNPLAFDPEDYACLVVGGGELLTRKGDFFYDLFRLHGPHILNTVGLRSLDDASFLRDYRYISVRSESDRDSIRLLEPELDVHVAPCISYLLEPEPSGISAADAIGVHIHHGLPFDPLHVADTINTLGLGSQVLFLPFTHYVHDADLMRRVSDMIPGSRVAPELGPCQLLDVVRQLKCLVSSSLHASTFAFTSNVPIVGIPVSDKIRNFFSERQLANWLVSTPQGLAEVIQKALDAPQDYSQMLIADRANLAKHLDTIRSLLSRPEEGPTASLTRPRDSREAAVGVEELRRQLFASRTENQALVASSACRRLESEIALRSASHYAENLESVIRAKDEYLQRLETYTRNVEREAEGRATHISQLERRIVELESTSDAGNSRDPGE